MPRQINISTQPIGGMTPSEVVAEATVLSQLLVDGSCDAETTPLARSRLRELEAAQRRAYLDQSREERMQAALDRGSPVAARSAFASQVSAALQEYRDPQGRIRGLPSGLNLGSFEAHPSIFAQMSRGTPGDAPNEWSGGAYPPWSPPSDVVTHFGRAPLTLLDLIPIIPHDYAQHVYYRETSYNPSPELNAAKDDLFSRDGTTAASAAAARSEGAALAQSAFSYERVADTIESVGHRGKVTQEQLDDAVQFEVYLDRLMRFGVRQAINRALLNGTGASPQIKGFLAYAFDDSGTSDAAKLANLQNSFSRVTVDASDSDTDAKAGKNLLLALRSAITRIQVEGGTMPTAILLHPESWEMIETLESGDGFYIRDQRPIGSMNGVPTVWNVPVAFDQYGLRPFTASTKASGAPTVSLLGDFAGQSDIRMRRDVTVEFGTSSDDFDKLIQSVRAYARFSLSVYRLRSFITVQVVA